MKIRNSNKFKSVISPRPRLSIPEWVEKYRVLGPPSEEQGPMRMDRTPYLRPVLDALSPKSKIQKVVFMKPAQIAGTEAALSVAGFYTSYRPSSVMLVMADEDTAQYMMRERIVKMFRNSRGLKRLVQWDTSTQRDLRLFNGSYMTVGWSSSVARLASRPIQVVIFDEVDKPGYYVSTREASPVSLGIERTKSFFNPKILILSTPTDEEGNIFTELKACDAIIDWHVPCSKCGLYQPLRWSEKYPGGFVDGGFRGHDGKMHRIGYIDLKTACYVCGGCGHHLNTIEKNFAVGHGIAVPRTELTGSESSVGFHVNRLYSLLGKSGDLDLIVKNYQEVKDSPDNLQGFVNSTLGEPFARTQIEINDKKLEAACSNYSRGTVPDAAVALVCFVDVHKTNFWYAARAFAGDFTSWLVDWGQIVGDFNDLSQFIFNTQYRQTGGNVMGFWRVGIDIGGGKYSGDAYSSTEQTYIWALQHLGRVPPIFLMKGASKAMATRIKVGSPIEKLPSGQALPRGVRVISVATDTMKDLVHFRLQNAIDQVTEAAYLPKDIDNNYPHQFLAEEKRWNRKKRAFEWVAVHRDNHLFDCEVGCHALVDPEFPGGGVNIFANRVNKSRNPQQKLQKDVDRPSNRVVKRRGCVQW
jgi:phage terminase large subunit GpA-like protein